MDPQGEDSINTMINHCGLGCVVISFLTVLSQIGWLQDYFSKWSGRSLTDQSSTPVDIIRFEPLVLAQLSGTHADREIIDLSDLPC